MRNFRQIRIAGKQGGSALVAVLVTVSVLVALAGAALTVSVSSSEEVDSEGGEVRALYLAEAAVSEALFEMNVARVAEAQLPTTIGSEKAPLEMQQGEFWANVTDNGDGTHTIRATGQVNKSQRTVEAIIETSGGNVFDNALFAGNSSGDPAYNLKFSGVGAQGDEITGDIYSGGNAEVSEDAIVNGDLRAAGAISGMKGSAGQSQKVPDIAAMKYEEIADVKVANDFAVDGEWKSSSVGGSAWQLPKDNPAHIFRKNPSDRASENGSTVKDDYYFEDPYEQSKSKDQKISLPMSGPNVVGNEQIYFIDGNLWLHNKKSYGFKLHENSTGIRITVVVKGNIYFSDDLITNPHDKDAIAFIAISDEKVADSGNIYFGDPSFGTLANMEAFMFAENDFYDYNLDASGSSVVRVKGTMSAGNQISITRDFKKSNGSVAHSKLIVEYDPRISLGLVSLPGMPQYGAGGDYVVSAWRELGGGHSDAETVWHSSYGGEEATKETGQGKSQGQGNPK